MAVAFAVCSRAKRKMVQERRRWMAATTMAPKAPMAAASVGAASPRKIVPSTKKIRTKGDHMDRSARHRSDQVGVSSGLKRGAALGFRRAYPTEKRMYNPERTSPGKTEPR